MACMADDQKEDTDMDQLHNFLQNTLPKWLKHISRYYRRTGKFEVKTQISTDR